MDLSAEYLKPTYFCDFHRVLSIGQTAIEVAGKVEDKQQKADCIYRFVKEFPYALEDWDVKASETLQKGWGMCSGKTNLLVALLRSLGIPARYRIIKIHSEADLWQWIINENHSTSNRLGEFGAEQDHVTAEVFLERWESYDPSRDSAFEAGLQTLGIPLERTPVTGHDGISTSMVLSSIDKWARQRQEARHFREDRHVIFEVINEQLEGIRLAGRHKLQVK